jgi:molybdopterin converting factor subunit 1
MKINLVAFGIARDILKDSNITFEINKGKTIGDLKNALTKQYPEFEKLASLRFAVDEDYQEDDFELSEENEVVIIPPVSGG